ncbi:hypothetical protein [Leucobacter sp. cx-169]|uniref:hypothetical protein n=1 Tax=Leucobacter sp. cx-169 TaxID=2770549 RepID=UPI00165EAFD2|nr:hypothetical protein [Leucobacter sp. cx-169]MBC9927172.1 hypothetical protein [Leucobacter sp. cx-169]
MRFSAENPDRFNALQYANDDTSNAYSMGALSVINKVVATGEVGEDFIVKVNRIGIRKGQDSIRNIDDLESGTEGFYVSVAVRVDTFGPNDVTEAMSKLEKEILDDLRSAKLAAADAEVEALSKKLAAAEAARARLN